MSDSGYSLRDQNNLLALVPSLEDLPKELTQLTFTLPLGEVCEQPRRNSFSGASTNLFSHESIRQFVMCVKDSMEWLQKQWIAEKCETQRYSAECENLRRSHNAEHSEYVSERTEFSREISTLKSQLNSISSEKDNLQMKGECLTKEFNTLRSNFEHGKSQLQKVDAERVSLISRCAELERTNSRGSSELTNAKESFEKVFLEHSDLQKKFSSLSARSEKQLSELDQLRHSVSSFQKETTSSNVLQAQVSDLKLQLDQCNEILQSVRSEKAELRSRLEQSRAESDSRQQRLNDAEKFIDDLQNQISETKTGSSKKIQELGGLLHTLRTSESEATITCIQLRNANSASRSEISNLKYTLRELSQKLSDTENINRELCKTNKNLSDSVKTLKSDIVSLQKKIPQTKLDQFGYSSICSGEEHDFRKKDLTHNRKLSSLSGRNSVCEQKELKDLIASEVRVATQPLDKKLSEMMLLLGTSRPPSDSGRGRSKSRHEDEHTDDEKRHDDIGQNSRRTHKQSDSVDDSPSGEESSHKESDASENIRSAENNRSLIENVRGDTTQMHRMSRQGFQKCFLTKLYISNVSMETISELRAGFDTFVRFPKLANGTRTWR